MAMTPPANAPPRQKQFPISPKFRSQSGEPDGCSPTVSEFNQLFESEALFPGFRHVFQAVDPDLPPEIEPFSFLSAHLLHHINHELSLKTGNVLADLGCGRGGPGLWLARAADADLLGIDFFPVAVAQATGRAARFHMADRARFIVGDLAATGLPDASVDAAIAIDTLAYAANKMAVLNEIRRIVSPPWAACVHRLAPVHPWRSASTL